MEAWGFFFFLVGGGGLRRVLARRGDRPSAVLLWRDLRRRVASWLNTCRPRRRRRRMRLLLAVVAPPRASSVRVDRSSAAPGRGLFRRVASCFFLPVGRGVDAHGRICVRVSSPSQKNRRASRCSRYSRYSESFRSRQLGAAVASRVHRQITALHAIAAETAAHPRRRKSARDEGRATQRSNG